MDTRLLLAALAFVMPASALAGPAEQIADLLDKKRCEDAFSLISEVEVGDPPSEKQQAAGRTIVRNATACRQRDAVLGFAFTELASKLAPDDPAVQTAHAESFLALQQRGDAAALLDRILEEHPEDAPRARLLRGRLAYEENEYELAIKILKYLEGDEQYGQHAEELVDEASAAIDERRKANLALESNDPAKILKAANQEEERRKKERAAKGVAPGVLVVSLKGKVTQGGNKAFVAKGVKKGENYVFRATGMCTRKGATGTRTTKKKGTIIEDPYRDIFGLDFAVQFGAAQPRQLSMGQHKPEYNALPFTADADNMTIRVWDRSVVEKGVKCSLGEFSVETQ